MSFAGTDNIMAAALTDITNNLNMYTSQLAAFSVRRSSLFAVPILNMTTNLSNVTSNDVTSRLEMTSTHATKVTSPRDTSDGVSRDLDSAVDNAQLHQANIKETTHTVHKLEKYSQYLTKFFHGKDLLSGRDLNILSPTSL